MKLKRALIMIAACCIVCGCSSERGDKESFTDVKDNLESAVDLLYSGDEEAIKEGIESGTAEKIIEEYEALGDGSDLDITARLNETISSIQSEDDSDLDDWGDAEEQIKNIDDASDDIEDISRREEQKIKNNKEAAEKVDKLIQEAYDCTASEVKDKLAQAREAYESLTDDEKYYVEKLEMLEDWEAMWRDYDPDSEYTGIDIDDSIDPSEASTVIDDEWEENTVTEDEEDTSLDNTPSEYEATAEPTSYVMEYRPKMYYSRKITDDDELEQAWKGDDGNGLIVDGLRIDSRIREKDGRYYVSKDLFKEDDAITLRVGDTSFMRVSLIGWEQSKESYLNNPIADNTINKLIIYDGNRFSAYAEMFGNDTVITGSIENGKLSLDDYSILFPDYNTER